ncbi:MAG: methyltransferase, partial [Pyrinomonadaceae bacterium]
MNENIEKFIEELEKSLAANTFVKMTLGNYKGSEAHLQKIFVRLVDTKKGERLLFQFRYGTRDVVKNLEFGEGVAAARNDLENGFRSGHLFTTESDLQLEIGKRNSRLKPGKPTFSERPAAAHDREKKTLINPNAFYLKTLGIATDSGEIRASQHDKWRQINKFVEILANLVENSSLKDKPGLRIVDMGSGKGYLTFAAYDYFAKKVRTASGSDRPPSSPPYEGRVAT